MIIRLLKILFVGFSLFFVTFLFSCTDVLSDHVNNNVESKIINGTVDISNNGKIRLQRYNRYKLIGNWLFFPNNLYSPEEVNKVKKDKQKTIAVPGDWSEFVGKNSKDSKGVGTYYLKFSIDKSDINGDYALYFSTINSPMAVFLNGKNIGNQGRVSSQIENTKFILNDNIISLKPLKKDNELIIQLSNLKHMHLGGLVVSPEIVSTKWFIKTREFKTMLSTFFVTSFALLGIIFSILYIIRFKEKSLILFAVSSIFYSLYLLFSLKQGFCYFLPQFDYYIIFKIERYFQIFAVGLFLISNLSLFKKTNNEWVIYAVASMIFILSVLIIILPINIIDQYYFILYLIFSLILFANIILLFLNISSRQKGMLTTIILLLPVSMVSIYNAIVFFGFASSILHLMDIPILIYFIVQFFLMQLIMNDLYIGRERLKRKNQNLQRKIYIDTLTGIPNQKRFRAIIQYYWNYCINEDKFLTLGYIDIDFFSLFNQHYGSIMGDVCIKKIGQIINDTLRRPEDFVGRDQGQRFVFMLPDTNVANAKAASERIREAVDKSAIEHKGIGDKARVTVSVGACSFQPANSISTSKIIYGSMKALYKAKNSGKNKCVVFIVKKNS